MTDTARDTSAARAEIQSVGGKRKFFKSGTAERIWRESDPISGVQLCFEEKAVADFLLHVAFSENYEVRETESSLCAMANLTPKTFRKWVSRLVERGLVVVTHSKNDNRKVYNVLPLFKQYGEERPLNVNEKVIGIDATTGKVYRTGKWNIKAAAAMRFGKLYRTRSVISTDPVREIATDRSVNDTEPVQQTLPNATVSSSSSSSLSPSPQEHGPPLARRLGLIDDTTRKYAHELAIADAALFAWTVSKRRQREIFQRYGLSGTFNAIGYVLSQIRLHPGSIRFPGRLVEHAAKEGKASEMPSYEDTVATLRIGKLYRSDEHEYCAAIVAQPSAPLAVMRPETATAHGEVQSEASGNVYRTSRDSVVEHPAFGRAMCELERMMPAPIVGTFVRTAHLVDVVDDCFTVGYEQPFVRKMAEDRIGALLREEIRKIAGEHVTVKFVVAPRPSVTV